MGSYPPPRGPNQSQADYAEMLTRINPGAFGPVPMPPRSMFDSDDAYVEHVRRRLRVGWGEFVLIPLVIVVLGLLIYFTT